MNKIKFILNYIDIILQIYILCGNNIINKILQNKIKITLTLFHWLFIDHL